MDLSQVPGNNVLIKNMVHTCVSRKSQKCVIFLGKMQEISALEANVDNFQQISVKYFPFPYRDTSLMTKIWPKVYTYIGDAKTPVKLKEK